MPKRVSVRLSWSRTIQRYITQGTEQLTFRLDDGESESWSKWLAPLSTFSFTSQTGESCTVRKERIQGDHRYWYAYKRQPNRVSKRYLGRNEDVTIARLESVAEQLAGVADNKEYKTDLNKDISLVLPEFANNPVPNLNLIALPKSEIPATKISIPRRPPRLLDRPHVAHRLTQGLDRPFTLLCAPAGFGKTTALSAWVRTVNVSVSWVTFSSVDNQHTKLWESIFHALNQIDTNIGAPLLEHLWMRHERVIENIALYTINALANFTNDIVLVLDEYQHITDPRAHASLATLIEHAPSRLHIYMATRVEPPFPLARLRAYDLVTLIRADDLRLRLDEVATFLFHNMRLDLSPEMVMTLAERTDGWITGIQIAGIALQEHSNPSAFISSFSGSHRHVLSYFIDEVLNSQSSHVRTFLIQTSILDELNGSLCDAVTGGNDGHEMLEYLEKSNLFLVALDDTGHWFRYYHPFKDLLRYRLQQEQPATVPGLHCQSASWFANHQDMKLAILHWIAGQDIDQAATLLENHAEDLLASGKLGELQSLIESFPESEIQARPPLCLALAELAFHGGNLNLAREMLDQADRHLNAGPVPNNRLSARVASGYATLAMMLGNLAETQEYARQAMDLISPDDQFVHGQLLIPLGIASMLAGDLTKAEQLLSQGGQLSLAYHHVGNASVALLMHSLVLKLQGRLVEAMHLCDRIIQLTDNHKSTAQVLAGQAYISLGQILYERNQLIEARLAFEKARDLGTQWENKQDQAESWVGLAWIAQTQGQHEPAYDMIRRAKNLISDSPPLHPWVMPYVMGMYARLALAQGRTNEVNDWLAIITQSERPIQLREFENAILVRILIAQGKLDEASHIISDFQPLLEEHNVIERLIEILMLKARIAQERGQISEALSTIVQSLRLAVPSGYQRMFIDEGNLIRTLLIRAKSRIEKDKELQQFVQGILNEWNKDPQSPQIETQSLILLSQREKEILRLIAEGHSNEEIAHHFIVALSTVKTHVHHLLTKLQASDRLQAVVRARQIGLLS
jgi:LuxR family maltose regulon positive regulatory protein